MSIFFNTLKKYGLIIGLVMTTCTAVIVVSFIDDSYRSNIPQESYDQILSSYGIKEIIFHFDQPMVSFTSYKKSAEEWAELIDLSFSPEVSGSIRTISSSSFAYVFDQPIDEDLEISYNTEIVSLEGEIPTWTINYQDSKKSPFLFSKEDFYIPYASYQEDSLRNPIRLSLSRPIKLKDLKNAMSLTDQEKQNIRFHLSYETYTNRSSITTNYTSVQVFAPFQKHSSYTLTVNYQKLSSPLPEYRYTFETYNPPQWKEIRSGRNYISTLSEETNLVFDMGQDLWLIPTNPLKSSNTNSLLTINPPVSNVLYSIESYGIKITGDFVGGQEYQIEFVPKNLQDIYFQPLTNHFQTHFAINHHLPTISQVQESLYIDRENPILSFQSVNVTNITLIYQAVNSAYYGALVLEGKPVPVPYNQTNITLNAPVDQIVWHEIDLSEILAKKTVLLLVNIQNTKIPSSETNYTKILPTLSGVTAHISTSDLLLSIKNIKNNEIYENMMISIWDPIRHSFQDLGRTASDGFLRVPNPRLPFEALEKPIFMGMYESLSGFNNIAFLSSDKSYFNSIDKKGDFYSSSLLQHHNINDSQRITTMLFTDRSVYLPQEPVHIQALIRAKENGQYTSSPNLIPLTATIKILDPSRQILTNTTKRWSDIGSLSLSLTSEQTKTSGLYTIEINSTDELRQQAYFHVYPITSKNKDILFFTPQKDYLFGEKLSFTLFPRFLHGQTLLTEITYKVVGTSFPFRSDAYPNHHFGTEFLRPLHIMPKEIPLFQQTVKNSDTMPIIAINHPLSVPRSDNLKLTISAFSDTDLELAFVDNSITVYQPVQLGIKASSSIVTNHETISFDLIALDSIKDEVKASTPITVSIIQEKPISLGSFSFITNIIPFQKDTYEQIKYQESFLLGERIFNYTPKEAGHYKIILNNFQNSVQSILPFRVLDDDSLYRPLSLELDQKNYQSGDTAVLTIINPFPEATILLILSKDTIREYHRISSTDRIIDFPIALTQNDEPGIMVMAIVSSINDNLQNSRILSQEIPLRVSPDNKKLSLSVQSSQTTYQPKDKVTLSLNAYNTQNQQIDGEAIVIIRDRSVLDDNNESIPDPIDTFYSIIPQGFTTWNSGKQLLDSLYFPQKVDATNRPPVPVLYQNMAKGMAFRQGKIASLQDTRSNFIYTVFYQGDVPLYSDKSSTVDFTLPDNISEFEITVIAYDKGGLFGTTNHSFANNKELFVCSITPPFVRPHDTVTWGALVHNTTDQPIESTISLDHSDSRFQTNITLSPQSQTTITNITTIISNNKAWTMSALSEKYQDTLMMNIPLIIDNPWISSSDSGILLESTNITIPTISSNTLQQSLTVELSSSPIIKIKAPINKILNSESLFLESILQRLLISLEFQSNLIAYQLTDIKNNELSSKIQKDLDTLVHYPLNQNTIATIPTNKLRSSDTMLILRVYESLLLALQHNYQVDTDLFLQLTEIAQKIIQKRNTPTVSDAIAKAFALKLLALNHTLDRESFRDSISTLPEHPDVQALILDTMHLLGFPLSDISLQTQKSRTFTRETSTTIELPANAPYIPSTLIRYYGDFENASKIINGLFPDHIQNLRAYLYFLSKYPIAQKTEVLATINNQQYSISNTFVLDLPITGDQTTLTMKSDQEVFYALHYSYIPSVISSNLNTGYQITKKIFDKDSNEEITNNTLSIGKAYTVEITINPSARTAQQIEIIDPLYGGTILPREDEFSKARTYSYFAQKDKITLFTRISSSTKLRYTIIAQTRGEWTSPPTSVHRSNAPEVFGIQEQPNIVVE